MAIVFDGNDSIEMPNITIPNGATGIATYTFWVRVDTSGGLQRPWGSETHNEARFSGGLLMVNDLFEGTAKATATTVLVVGDWFFFGFTGDANANTHEIYTNGVLEDSATDAIGSTVGTSLSFGVRTGTSQNLTGALDDWRMYDRILSSEEIATIHACRGHDGIMEGLLHRFIYQEGAAGTTVSALVDISGGGGGGSETVTGNPVYGESDLSFTRLFV